MTALVLAALAALLLRAAPVLADEWTRADTARESVVIALIAVDVGTTMMQLDRGGYERNPVIGRFPSHARLLTLAATAAAGHALTAWILPRPYREVWQVGIAVVEGVTITGNVLVLTGIMRF